MNYLDEKAIKCITSDTLEVADGDVETERKIEVPNIYATNFNYCECDGKIQLIGLNGKPIGKEIDLPVEQIIDGVEVNNDTGIVTIKFFNYGSVEIKFKEIFEKGFNEELVVEEENINSLLTELDL